MGRTTRAVYACGCQRDIPLLYRNARDREHKLLRLEQQICPVCKKEERLALIAEWVEAVGLEPLQGTEAQVVWAEELRYERLVDSTLYVEERDAAWWIDRRFDSSAAFAANTSAVEVMVWLRPEVHTTKSVTLRTKDGAIAAIYWSSDEVVSLLKGLGFRWSGVGWERLVPWYTGTTANRLVDIVASLLLDGVSCRVPDADVARRVECGEYEPEPPFWVHAVEGAFLIQWSGYSDDAYAKASTIGRWDRRLGGIVVGGNQYAQILDFSTETGAVLTDKAKELVTVQESEEQRRVLPASPVNEEPIEVDYDLYDTDD